MDPSTTALPALWAEGRTRFTDLLVKLNGEHGFFERILPLEHPRFIMQ